MEKLTYNEDCFAFNEVNRSCAILKRFYSYARFYQCAGCPFYKTWDTFFDERKKALRRLEGKSGE